MRQTIDCSTGPQPSDWPLLALCLAWSVAQGSLLQSDAAAPGAALGDATFIVGVAISIGAHEAVRAGLERWPARDALSRSRRGRPAGIFAALLPPMANLLVGGAVFLTARLAFLSGGADALVRALAAVVTLNVVLAATLLVPALPMDGGRLLRAIVCAAGGRPERGARVAALVTETVGWLLLVAGLATALAYGASAGFLWVLTATLVLRAGHAERRRLALLGPSTEPAAGPPGAALERLRPHVI